MTTFWLSPWWWLGRNITRICLQLFICPFDCYRNVSVTLIAFSRTLTKLKRLFLFPSHLASCTHGVERDDHTTWQGLETLESIDMIIGGMAVVTNTHFVCEIRAGVCTSNDFSSFICDFSTVRRTHVFRSSFESMEPFSLSRCMKIGVDAYGWKKNTPRSNPVRCSQQPNMF